MKRTAIVLLSAALAGAAWGQSQAKPAKPQAPFTFKTNVGEVLVHATVVDKKDQAVTTLPESDFTIFENGVQQKIEYFAREDAPVSVGILVDNSGSMSQSRPEVNRAAINFVKASNTQDEVFIVNFNSDYYLDAAFTNSIPKLQDGLGRIESSGGTAMYDAIIASLDYMNDNARNDKHVLLVVTDGDDDASRYTLEQAVRMLQADNPPMIYTIGILSNDDTRSMKNKSKRALEALATATGGLAYFPKNLKEVNDISLQVARDIRSQYTFAYHSNQTGSGFRKIQIDAKDPKIKNLTVRSRQGYYQPANSGR
ncbi:MAG TPA: VWA domain-containing protein [Terriglobales bacterium]|nr:VWA domain-containing protein [Terriglobales bacterium]